jgi:hypothetical protein
MEGEPAARLQEDRRFGVPQLADPISLSTSPPPEPLLVVGPAAPTTAANHAQGQGNPECSACLEREVHAQLFTTGPGRRTDSLLTRLLTVVASSSLFARSLLAYGVA